MLAALIPLLLANLVVSALNSLLIRRTKAKKQSRPKQRSRADPNRANRQPNMAAAQLSSGFLAKSTSDEQFQEPGTLKVVKASVLPKGHIKCTLSDGSSSMPGRLLSQCKKALEAAGQGFREGAVIRVQHYAVNVLKDEQTMIVTGLELVQQGDGAEPAAEAAASDAAGSKPDQQATPTAAKQPPSTPAAAAGGTRSLLGTPGPAPSPSEEVKGTPAVTPSVRPQVPYTPPTSTPSAAAAATISVAERAGVQPIAALNPYQKNWCIKAKVTRKGLMRSFGAGGAANKVFDVDLADAAGTQIQGNFWRESADKYYDSLEEGKVYYLSHFTVKVANKQYTTVRNDYQINFDGRTEVEEAKDQSGITDLQVELVPFDKLPKHIGRKAPIDVLGVVTSVGLVGSVKRKSDNSDLTRRDITLADASGFSVNLTLWGDAALREDFREGAILQVTLVKANDFNGCSLSGLTRSKVTIDPDTPEAAELRTWWSSEGSTATLTPLGQSLAGGAGAGARKNKLELLSAVMPDGPLPAPDAKPTYHDVIVTIAQVMAEDRPLMYLANPENGKKVVDQEGRFWCEGDQKYVEQAQQRYMMTVRVADMTGETYATMFNDQATQLFGCSADEAKTKQDEDHKSYDSMIRNAQWSEWHMTLMARSREYQGERKLRINVQRMKPVDYAQEGHRLLQLIQQPAQQQ